MSKKLSAVLILCMSTVCLSGCYLLRVTGPCYGVGCPAGAAGHSGQYKQGEGPKAQNAPAPAKSASAPTHTAAAHPKTVEPNTPTETASASTTPQPTAAQSPAAQTAAKPASTEAKPSPLHSIGEFFENLIPHHNSGAKSGAAD
jgi:hypothetical protein